MAGKTVVVKLPDGDVSKFTDETVRKLVGEAARSAGIKADDLVIEAGGSDPSSVTPQTSWGRRC